MAECKNKKYKYVLRLDIDNFFDTIDHFLLRRRLAGTGTEEEISDDKRRRQVVKLMESIGTRMNFSVFECMLTDIQYQSMCKRLARLVVRREDWVNIYPLCTECYARIEYIPPVKKKEPVKIAVV